MFAIMSEYLKFITIARSLRDLRDNVFVGCVVYSDGRHNELVMKLNEESQKCDASQFLEVRNIVHYAKKQKDLQRVSNCIRVLYKKEYNLSGLLEDLKSGKKIVPVPDVAKVTASVLARLDDIAIKRTRLQSEYDSLVELLNNQHVSPKEQNSHQRELAEHLQSIVDDYMKEIKLNE